MLSSKMCFVKRIYMVIIKPPGLIHLQTILDWCTNKQINIVILPGTNGGTLLLKCNIVDIILFNFKFGGYWDEYTVEENLDTEETILVAKF